MRILDARVEFEDSGFTLYWQCACGRPHRLEEGRTVVTCECGRIWHVRPKPSFVVKTEIDVTEEDA